MSTSVATPAEFRSLPPPFSIDVPADSRSPLLHCDFNTGLVYLRSKPATIEFAERWRETVANAKEHRIRDQAAFNMLTKACVGLCSME